MADEIKAGNIVQLNSGSPDMTVDFVNDVLGQASCSWFSKDNKRQTELFNLLSLKLAPTKEK